MFFLKACDIKAVILPNHDSSLHILPRLDGVIFSGGNTLVKYGGDAPERDSLERNILLWAVSHKFPLIGVCRGMQMMIDFAGGTPIETPQHIGSRHDVELPEQNRIRIVNSFHSWGFKEVPSTYHVWARCGDGVIEGVRHHVLPFCGIMWHPEREKTFNADDKKLFIEMFKK
jgi:putative glutamine amidotransferase